MDFRLVSGFDTVDVCVEAVDILAERSDRGTMHIYALIAQLVVLLLGLPFVIGMVVKAWRDWRREIARTDAMRRHLLSDRER